MDAESAMRVGKKAKIERWMRFEAIVVCSVASNRENRSASRSSGIWTSPERSFALIRRTPAQRSQGDHPYLRVVPISLNTVLTLVPTVWTAVMMKTAISEAISAYSIAVTPDSSATNLFID